MATATIIFRVKAAVSVRRRGASFDPESAAERRKAMAALQSELGIN